MSAMHQPALQPTRIRLRQDADLAACAAILCRVYTASGYPIGGVDNPETKLCTGGIRQAWVAERNSQVIGHVAIATGEDDLSIRLWKQTHPDEQVATLGKLFVDPEHQGGGAATKLIQAVSACSKDAGMRLVLFVLIKDQPAIRLYGRLGWTEFGKVVYHYGEGQQMDGICFVCPDHQD